jgi:hypothetical protein
MKRETARYVVECDTCRRVKADHLRSAGLVQPLNVPEWKREDINMDFIMAPPLSAHKYDTISLIVDQFTKSTHFILVHTNYRAEKYAELYIAYNIYLHGMPKTIIFDRGP